MEKEKLKDLYKLKIKDFKSNNFLYFEKNDPKISDADFDKLKKEILDLEKKYSYLKDEDSPSRVLGYKPSKNFHKLKHKVPMLSLANAFSEDDLLNFEKRVFNYLDKKKDFEIEYSAEPKIDGISASLIYKKGKFITGLSRGDGKEGENITENLKTINDIPQLIKDKTFPDEIDIRGEVFIQNSDFKKLSNSFANPRNAASGSLRQKDSNETKKIPLKFIAYTFGHVKNIQIDTQADYLKRLHKWGFKTNPLNKIITGIKNLIKNYNEIEKKRDQLDFDIDGVVYKINDFKLQKRLGNVTNAPRWAIAHKFSANNGVSKIINIEIQIGRTGALTPVAKIKPINIGGVVVSNATLHNEEEIIRKDIRLGDTVLIERAGDVIPHVISVDLKERGNNSSKFKFPIKCPSCGSKTIKEYNMTTKKNDAVRRCSSAGYECEKVAIEKIKHFVSKEALNIEGFGKKIVESFWKINLIRFPQDIFNLNFDKIEKLEGWGKQSARNLKYSIDQKKKVSFERFIYSLGIRHIGLENAKTLSKYFKSLPNFLSLSVKGHFNELLNIDGIGETQVNSIKIFFSNKTNLNILNQLKKILFVNEVNLTKKGGLLKNKTFMLTGKLDGISRAEAKSLIEENSGTTVSSVSKKLNFLITGDKPTKRKVENAKKLKIKIIKQAEWLKMLNLIS